MIADMLSNINLNPIVNELFIRGRKLNNYTDYIQHTILLRKFQINQNLNKLHPIIHQIMTLKTL